MNSIIASVIGFLALATTAFSQELPPGEAGSTSIGTITGNSGIIVQTQVLTFNSSSSFVFRTGKALVTIKADGTVEYGEGYDPDETARVFWEAIGRARVCQ